VLTISDGVAAGTRRDASGDALTKRLSDLGYAVDRGVVPDDVAAIRAEVMAQAVRCRLLVSTGGTGLGPRDVTPQALRQVLDYEIPGFGEVMRTAGRLATPMADLSRSLAGVRGGTLVVAVPGSVSGATESLDALVPLLSHALETLGGHTEHGLGEGHDGSGAVEAGEQADHGPGEA
jgi:molybdenum cofactor synthesis domain-containing protein